MKEIIYSDELDKFVDCQVDDVVNNCEFEQDMDFLMKEFLEGPKSDI